MAIYLLISQLPTWATTVIVEVVIGDKKSRPCLLTNHALFPVSVMSGDTIYVILDYI